MASEWRKNEGEKIYVSSVGERQVMSCEYAGNRLCQMLLGEVG